jgi:hypothetical protein
MILSNNFYTTPDIASQTMTRKDLKEILLKTDGKIISCGRLREINAKHIGAGVYRITLKPLNNNQS